MTFNHPVPVSLLRVFVNGRRKERRSLEGKRHEKKVIEEGWKGEGKDEVILEEGMKV